MSAQQRHRALRQKKKKERENNTQNNSKSQKQQQQNAGHISFTSLCHRRNEKEIGRSGDNRVFTASAILSEKKKMVKGFVAHARPPPPNKKKKKKTVSVKLLRLHCCILLSNLPACKVTQALYGEG